MDVEEWMNQEENEDDQWEYELRVCAPSLYLLLAPNRFPSTAMRGACTLNLVNAVQGLCHPYPTGILRHRCRCVDRCLMPGSKLINLSPIIPGAVGHSC